MNSLKKDSLPELLAPAGSFDALCAAVEAGADAVYFGASDFNARMRAKNFTDAELEQAINLCLEYGVKTYITLNTRLRDGELGSAVRRAFDLYEKGASAFIIADTALAKMLKDAFPGIELHASTQLSGHSALDAEAFRSMGFSRMVCPREMSCSDIKELVKKSSVEIEMFIHGAHCVSFSGQCMMSFAMGGRSGNRGECAQPCRLPFSVGTVRNSHPLSLRDMCLAASIKEVIGTGVASLKIEGRQKSPDYVYGVCRIYRRLLDEKRNASEGEVAELERLFCRDGFTDGYFKGSYRSMLGIRSPEDIRSSRSAESFGGLKRKIPVSAHLFLKVGDRARLEVTDGTRHAEVYGEVTGCDAARALSCMAARENMSRLGNTAFVLNEFEMSADPDAFYTLSGVNKLRREAVKILSAPPDGRCARGECSGQIEKTDNFGRQFLPLTLPLSEDSVFSGSVGARSACASSEGKRVERITRTAEFTDFSLVCPEAFEYFDKIYVPFSDICHTDGEKICLSFAPLLFDSQVDGVRKKLEGYSGEILVHGFGQAMLAREMGLKPAASFRFNVFSRFGAETVSKYADFPAMSPEIPLAAASDVRVPFSLIIYGKVPLMHTMRCFMSDGGVSCPFCGNGGRYFSGSLNARKKSGEVLCKGGEFGKNLRESHSERRILSCENGICRGTLYDRKGMGFPVIGLPDCTNIIYNSVPIYMADRQGELDLPFAARHHYIFSDETAEDCAKIIDEYKSASIPDRNRRIRRLK